MADTMPTGAPRVPPGRGSLAESYAAAEPRVNHRGGHVLDRSAYPAHPMSAVPTVLLNSFLAERQLDSDDTAGGPNDVEAQQIYAAWEGIKRRAVVCGGLRGHDVQAAALLVAIDELDQFLDGTLTVGKLSDKLDNEERGAIWLARDTMVRLLDWHLANGGGALAPIAQHMGLLPSTGRVS